MARVKARSYSADSRAADRKSSTEILLFSINAEFCDFIWTDLKWNFQSTLAVWIHVYVCVGVLVCCAVNKFLRGQKCASHEKFISQTIRLIYDKSEASSFRRPTDNRVQLEAERNPFYKSSLPWQISAWGQVNSNRWKWIINFVSWTWWMNGRFMSCMNMNRIDCIIHYNGCLSVAMYVYGSCMCTACLLNVRS